MSNTNPPSSAGGPPSAAATARAAASASGTQNLRRGVQAAFDGRIFPAIGVISPTSSCNGGLTIILLCRTRPYRIK